MTFRPPPLLRFTSASVAEVRRITLEPDGLLVETQNAIGSFYPQNQVFWDEVRAVYVWTAPDWRLIVVGIVLALVALPLGAWWGSTLVPGPDPFAPLLIGIGVAFVVLLGFSALGHYVVPARWFRLETDAGPVTFHSRRKDLPDRLLERLNV